MYIITCRTDDALVIGSPDGELTVTVVSVQGEKVRLGVDAPPHVPVHRGEVFLAIQSAASSNRPAIAARQAGSSVQPTSEGQRTTDQAVESCAIELTLSPDQIEWLDRLAKQLARTTDASSRGASLPNRAQLLGRLLDAWIALDDAHQIDTLLARLAIETDHAARPSKPRKAR